MASLRRDADLRPIDRLFGEGTLAGLSDARLLERYAAHRDELAFEALVRRHGSMVLNVCRRVLEDPNDAEDAFQAAFLLLARKARSIRVDGSVGGWLHRVAWRIALQVRSDAARRRDLERRAAGRTGEAIAPASWHDDSATVIHQEIDRLPERYRQPVVLCYLEDMTYQQAADHLRWSEATTRGRLARARDLLRSRLSRRGVTLAGIASPGAAATVPAALRDAAVRAARHLALGESAAVSSTTVALVRQAARAMMLARLKAIAAAALVVAAVTGLAAMGIGDDRPRPAGSQRVSKVDPAPRAATEPAKAVEGETIAFRGWVADPAGKPAAGAAVYTAAPRADRKRVEPVLRAKADADGAYRFTMTQAEFDAAVGLGPWAALTVLAAADGLGPDWIDLKTPADGPINFRLVDDSVPIAGRILDLQGRPVVGATITRGEIRGAFNEDIKPYLKMLQEDGREASQHRFEKVYARMYGLPGRPASVTTNSDGRFRLTGIGRDRIVDLVVEGPTIQNARITAMTRAAAAVSTPKGIPISRTIYGATFEHLIPPGRALTGVVRDKRTGQPLAGIEVGGTGTGARTTTDAEGRYTLPGFPKGKSYGLMVLAGHRPPYFVTCVAAPDTAGLDPLRVDVDCVPGIPMRLKVTERETSRPVTGAVVFYWPIYPNPHVREVPGYEPVRAGGAYNSGIAQADGTYLLGVLPGPGAVFVRTAEGRYRPAGVDPQAFFRPGGDRRPAAGGAMVYGDRDTIIIAAGEGLTATPQDAYSAIVLLNPPDDSGPIAADAVLERDRKREVRVLGPDGEPLPGVTAEGAESTKTPGVMTVPGLNPMRPKRFTFRHDGRKLVGFLLLRGEEAGPHSVRLQPWGTIAGRLVDEQGRPRPGAYLLTSDWKDAQDDPTRGLVLGIKTDAGGHFRIEGLVPGQSYTASAVGDEAVNRGFGVVIDRVILKPGETRDLGDVRARPDRPGGGNG
jgi:RNA polymerase sigma factor (sigma-70 family)